MSTYEQSQPTKEELNKKLIHILRRLPIRNDQNKSAIEDINSLLREGADPNVQDQNGIAPLYWTALRDNKEAVEVLLKYGAKANAADGDEWIPLHWAALCGHKEVVEVLLNNGANVNTLNEDGRTPLHCATLYGHKEVVEVLLNNGAKINALDREGKTSLCWAAEDGHKEVVEILINKGAEVNSLDGKGRTPLHWAALSGHKEVVEVLLKYEAKVSTLDNGLWTPLRWAARKGHKEVIEVLLKHDAMSREEWTPLHCTAIYGNKEAVETLIASEANIDAVDREKWTPLHWAALHGNKEAVEVLLKHGANVNAVDKEEWTPLHVAAENGHKEVVEVLIKNLEDVNIVSKAGYTPLHCTAQNGNKEIAEILIKKLANVNVMSENGYTPLHCAAKNGHKELAEVLISNRADVNAVNKNRHTPLYWAAKNGHTKVAKALIDTGVNPLLGRRDVRLLKLLITLTKNDGLKHPGKVEESQQEKEPVDDEYELLKYSLLLREDRPLIDVVEKDTFDNLICTWFVDVSNLTPDQKKLNEELLGILKDFLLSSNEDRINCVTKLKKFIRKNEDNKEDLRVIVKLGRGESKLTLLHALSSIDDWVIEELIALLLKAGADLNAQDNSNRTPLHYAAYSGYCNVKFLLKKGALSISDKQEKTPLDIAIDNHNYYVEDYFLTDEQRNLKEELYSALVSDSQSQLEKLLNEHKNTQNLKKILNLHDREGRSEIFQIARNVLHNKEDLRKEIERLLLGAGAIDYEGLDKKEHLPKSGTLWDNLVLNQRELLKFFLHKVGEARDMNELKQVVIQAIESGVRFNFPHQGKLYGKAYESKYSFTDYVIKRIKDISESKKDPKVASDIVCELVSRGAVLYNIDSIFVIDTLESEFADHKTNMKRAYEDYMNHTIEFMEIAKSAATGEVKDAKIDNSTLYLEYSENSTVHVAKITDGARDLGLTQGEIGYGRDVIKIGKSEVEIITLNDIRYYTDLADGSDIVLIFPTSLGELKVRLYPDEQDQNLIRVEGNKEMLKKLEDCGEEIGKNCRLGRLSVKEAIEQGVFTRSGGLVRSEAMSPYEKAEAAVEGLEPGDIVNSSLGNTSLSSPIQESIRRIR